MKAHCYFFILFLLLVFTVSANNNKSIQEFGVLPENTPELNRGNLQKAIDWATSTGAALWVEPVAGGYPVAGGIRLKKMSL